MKFRETRREEPEINLVPMIDVLLMALIFLVLTTTFAREGQMRVRLPSATVATEKLPPAIQISIGADGRYSVNQQALADRHLVTLQGALQAAANGTGNPLIVVYADREAPYGAVIRAMDAARRLGFLRLTFATRSHPAPAVSP